MDWYFHSRLRPRSLRVRSPKMPGRDDGRQTLAPGKVARKTATKLQPKGGTACGYVGVERLDRLCKSTAQRASRAGGASQTSAVNMRVERSFASYAPRTLSKTAFQAIERDRFHQIVIHSGGEAHSRSSLKAFASGDDRGFFPSLKYSISRRVASSPSITASACRSREDRSRFFHGIKHRRPFST